MPPIPKQVSKGAGMTAGLEIWQIPGTQKKPAQFVLVDTSADNRFAGDVAQWNSAVGLNATALKKLKDAAK